MSGLGGGGLDSNRRALMSVVAPNKKPAALRSGAGKFHPRRHPLDGERDDGASRLMLSNGCGRKKSAPVGERGPLCVHVCLGHPSGRLHLGSAEKRAPVNYDRWRTARDDAAAPNATRGRSVPPTLLDDSDTIRTIEVTLAHKTPIFARNLRPRWAPHRPLSHNRLPGLRPR